MEIAEILDNLRYHDGTFPREALEQAIAKREEITPELLKILEHTADNIETLAKDYEYMAHIYASFLLAQFREERAYPLLIKNFSHHNHSAIRDLFGDVTTEDLNRILASVCGGDLEPIKGLIENPQIYEYVRSAGMDALLTLVVEDDLPRSDAVDYLGSLLRGKLADDDILYAWVISAATDLYPDELYDDIKRTFEEKPVDESVLNIEFVDMIKTRGKEKAMNDLQKTSRFHYIDDTIAEMENWAAFKPEPVVKPPPISPTIENQIVEDAHSPLVQKPSGQVVRQGEKIGRNDPCPCGSGKKYKKCCGKRG